MNNKLALRKASVWGVLLLLMIALAFYAYGRLYPAHHWRGITPGSTPKAHVLRLLGEPQIIEIRDNYEVLIYEYQRNTGWQRIEFWSDTHAENPVVDAIYLQNSIKGYLQEDALVTLGSIIASYGLPAQVTWNIYCFQRYIIFEEGIAVSASPDVRNQGLDQIIITDKLLFKPMDVQAFLQTAWPWEEIIPRPGNVNQCPERDKFPENPYDW